MKARSHTDWKDGFLFVGNHPALDFLNTRPVQNGEAVELIPNFSSLLRWLRAAELLSSRHASELQAKWGKTTRAEELTETLREEREKLRKDVLAWESNGSLHRSTIDRLNRVLAEHPMNTRLKREGKNISTELSFDPSEPENLFAPVAHSAAMLFAHVDSNRVRKCDRCVLHFFDTSKKGTRRWCSMQLCGNRFKVAAYAARQRDQAHE